MPIYEFVCNRCDKKFEVFFRSMTERKRNLCPTCGADDVRRALSLFGLSTGKSGASSGSSGSGCGSCRASSCAGCRR
ncbi:MAG: zinc ribbon domain-containing protein [Planctomycetes bacterium]|nr:zinc ribbon domain-containing protein [Planctomycetota bacterium]MBM4084633.1 zinc ribbon domain-containing protein [Planctomycetota bacterium]